MTLHGLWYQLIQGCDSDEVKASLALFIVSVCAIGIVALTERGDLTSAVLILCGFACFITGLLLLIIHHGGSISSDIAGILDPGSRLALARVAADLGVDGDAIIIPGNPMMQFTSSGLSGIPERDVGSSLVITDGVIGLAYPPTALPLYNHLKKNYDLINSCSVHDGVSAFVETIDQVLKLTDSVSGTIQGEGCIFDIVGYELFDGCALVQQESPKCCTMVPCAICGLAGVILAESTGESWKFEMIRLDRHKRSITLILSRVASSP